MRDKRADESKKVEIKVFTRGVRGLLGSVESLESIGGCSQAVCINFV